MAVLIDHQAVVVPTGTQTLGPVAIADSAATVLMRLARCTTLTPTIWPSAATHITLEALISVNNAAFIPLCSFGSDGGIYTLRSGSEAVESTIQTTLPAGINRRIQAQITVTNGPLVSNVTVEVN